MTGLLKHMEDRELHSLISGKNINEGLIKQTVERNNRKVGVGTL